jgi:hypothetical protein
MPNTLADHDSSNGSSRALVVVSHERLAPAERPSAGFVTQLIACNRRIGIYRKACRAEPAEATLRYRGVAETSRANFQRII